MSTTAQPPAPSSAAPALATPNPRSLEDRKKAKKPVKESLRVVMPDLIALISPRKGILILGLMLMAVNRVAGLVLPWSTKFLIDDVIGTHPPVGSRPEWLPNLLLLVVVATMIQGITAFRLTQVLSKEAQRLIAEMRRNVQAHIGRLPLAFYDANKSGTLVSRIMTDVEGVRNLIGTGLVEFLGGIITAFIALFVLLSISATMTLLAFGILLVFGIAVSFAIGTIRPIFRERGKIN